MTLTASFQELRDYQDAMQRWVTAHNNEVLRILPEFYDHAMMGMRPSGPAKIAERMNQWIADHPMPKLIPPT